VEGILDLPYFPNKNGEMFFLGGFTFDFCLNHVYGQEVECCKEQTTWGQAVSVISTLVCLINWNKAKSVF